MRTETSMLSFFSPVGGSNHNPIAAFRISLGGLNNHLSQQRAGGCRGESSFARGGSAQAPLKEHRSWHVPPALLHLQFMDSHCQAICPLAWKTTQETHLTFFYAEGIFHQPVPPFLLQLSNLSFRLWPDLSQYL